MKSMLQTISSHGMTASGSNPENACLCELDRSIEQALMAVHLAGRKKDILFARATGQDGLQVLSDPEKSARMIAAVLARAVHRSPTRGIVTLDIRPGAEGVVLAISDQGPRQPVASDQADPERMLTPALRGTVDGSTTRLSMEDEGATTTLTFTPA